MGWTTEEIQTNPCSHYKLDNKSHNHSGYHVYTKYAFEGYTTMVESQSLVYTIQPHNLNDDGIVDDDNISKIIKSSNF